MENFLHTLHIGLTSYLKRKSSSDNLYIKAKSLKGDDAKL